MYILVMLKRYLVTWKVKQVSDLSISPSDGLNYFQNNMKCTEKLVQLGYIKDWGFFNMYEGYTIIEQDESNPPPDEFFPKQEGADIHIQEILPKDKMISLIENNIRKKTEGQH